MKLYKLTNQEMKTQNGFGWEIGKQVNLIQIKNPELCTSDVIHGYKNLNLAILLNPIHANIEKPRCFEAKGEICVEDWGKVGCFSFNLIKEIELPKWTRDSQKKCRVQIQFAILCAEAILHFFKDKYPCDSRPEAAIMAAKKYLKVSITDTAARAADTAADASRAAYAAYAAYAADASRAAYAAYAAARAAAIDFQH